MLKEPEASPPVPTTSMASSGASTVSISARMAVTAPVISSTVSPRTRSPISSAPICDGVRRPTSWRRTPHTPSRATAPRRTQSLYHANILQQHDFHDFKISVKASDVFLAVAAYQQLAEVCDHPLHIGITEAGGRRMGTVKSSIGLGSLLWAGIGDTMRVSLSDEPEEEVRVGWDMLKTLGIRHRGVKVISCRPAPGKATT